MRSYWPPVLLCGVLLVLPLVDPAPPLSLAGTPPLVVIGALDEEAPPAWCAGPPGEAGATPAPTSPGRISDEPLPVLPEDGAPDVSGIGPTPADPELPPLRVSGATGVLTSTPLLGVPASDRPFDVLPEPTAAGVLPGLDSLRRSQPARATTATSPHKQGASADEESLTKCPIARILSMWRASGMRQVAFACETGLVLVLRRSGFAGIG